MRPEMEIVNVFVDGKHAGKVSVPRGADERTLAEAAATLTEASAAIRSRSVHETIRRGDRYELITGFRPGVPLTAEEAARLPGANFVPHPFHGI
ncbi:MAG: hypothetical protein M0D55_16920 [Elusimicrobiota bacterium]|nr:MAG: hypothetical protein M0D55_16920 [Elusimicrobiota bacterium]